MHQSQNLDQMHGCYYCIIVSASLYQRSAYATGVSPGPSHVSSGHPSRRIVMPFGVVSVVGLGSGVPDFGGDRRSGRGSLGVNKMQKWRIDRLLTRV